jgi:putative transposase
MILTETHSIKLSKKTKGLYNKIDDYCYKSKNLRNYTNYIITQCSRISYRLKNGEILESWEKKLIYDINCAIKRYNAGRKDKTPLKYIDSENGYIADAYFLSWYLKSHEVYKVMPYSTCSQVCIQTLCKDWKSFYKTIKLYLKNSANLLGRPKTPSFYDKKNGRNWLVLTSQQIKESSTGEIKFPSFLSGLHLKARHSNIRQVRIKTTYNKIIVQFMYEKTEQKSDVKVGSAIGIDLGVNNLAAVVSNTGMPPFIINGRTLKSINQYYNKELSRLRSAARKSNNVHTTKHICRLIEKRNNKVKDYLHKASCLIIKVALSNKIGTIVVGNNSGWKQNVHLGKRVNQNFVSIPYYQFISMLQYKAKLCGIEVKVVEEAYTSGTSFLDNELPIKKYYDKTRRVHRGLFISNNGDSINADINAAYQMLKKENIFATIRRNEKVVRLEVA